MILAVSLVVLLFASDASCETVVTYNSKPSEVLLCPITDATVGATWRDETTGNNLANYVKGGVPDIEIVDPVSKHENFVYSVDTTTFSLVIRPVQAEDGGNYVCSTIGGGGSGNFHNVVVEVLAKPTVKNGSQDVDVLNVIGGTSYDLTCSAAGARSMSKLSLMWDPSLVENTGLIVTPKGNFTDYSITSTYIAKKGDRTITCQLTGYVMQDEIDDQLITDTVNLNVRYAPMCSLTIQEGEDCTEVTLTCECDAVPADITQYSFFNGSININDGPSNTSTVSVAYETSTEFSCSATNDIGTGEKSDVNVHDCYKGTTALPTTTIVTTAPMSTNEPTSTKATESTTEKSGSTTTEKSDNGGLGPGAIAGICCSALAVIVVIVVIAVIVLKPGKCGSNSSSSSVTDVKVTATNSHTTNSEPAPAPVYGEIKKDRKKKSDKLDDNGAGPRGDPEIPAYGVVDKNRTKDPTPAPRSSMRDSKNPSNPKQDGPMEMQYADLDHGNKPASDEVRKPKEEPTEYATVQSVIV